MSKYEDRDHSTDLRIVRICEEKAYGGTVRKGVVETLEGFALVHSQEGGELTTFSEVELVRDGRAVIRRWNRAFTSRGLVTVARRFADEVFGA